MNEKQAEKVIQLLNAIKTGIGWITIWTFLLWLSSCVPNITGGS